MPRAGIDPLYGRLPAVGALVTLHLPGNLRADCNRLGTQLRLRRRAGVSNLNERE
jgi:hypothetical protein